MLSKNKAKEMKRRASQRRATHKARRAALPLSVETRMAAAAKAERGKTKVRSKGHVKSTVKVSKPKSLCVAALSASDSQRSPNKPWRPHYLSWSC